MRRAYAALITGTLIFVLTYLSAWISDKDSSLMGLGYHVTVRQYCNCYHEIELFQGQKERYPNSIEELKEFLIQECDYEPQHVKEYVLADPWDRPYLYEKTDTGFRVTSLGRVGDPNGIGLNAPIIYDEKQTHYQNPTFWQFITSGEGSKTLFIIALLASVSVGLIYFVSEKKRLSPVSADNYVDGTTQSPKPEHVIWTATKMTLTIAFAVFVALIMIVFHVGAQQSGH